MLSDDDDDDGAAIMTATIHSFNTYQLLQCVRNFTDFQNTVVDKTLYLHSIKFI